MLNILSKRNNLAYKYFCYILKANGSFNIVIFFVLSWEKRRMKIKRDISIDVLRGLAIFTMIAANTAGEILCEPHPFWFRFYGSFAAPLFVLLAGMMVFVTSNAKNYNLSYFVKRGLFIIGVAALLDITIWHIYPFMIFDVLYVIGFSLPVAYLLLKIKDNRLKYVVILSIFLITPLLQVVFGYPKDLKLLFLDDNVHLSSFISIMPHIFKNFIIDGFFPLFPWLGFSLLGANIAGLRYKLKEKFNKPVFFITGIGALISGIMLWIIWPGNMFTRAGYSEVFYPPTYGFMLTSVGLIVMLFYLVDRYPDLSFYKPLEVLGKSSMFVYISQEIIIRNLIAPVFHHVHFIKFTAIYIVFIASLMVLCYLWKNLKAFIYERKASTSHGFPSKA